VSANDFRSVFAELGERFGDCEAILAPGCAPLGFKTLGDRLASVKSALNGLGIGHGDRVALALPSGHGAAVCLLGAMSCTCAIPLDPATARSELQSVLYRVRPKALVVPRGARGPARDAAQALGIALIELSPHPAGALAGTFAFHGEAAPCADVRWNAGEDIAVILLTSGTTSRPKLVPWRARQFVAYAHGMGPVLRLGPGDRSLHFMPLHHGAGLKSSFLVPLLNGAAVVCLEKFEVDSFFEHLERFRPTWLTAGYTFHRAILDGVDAHRDVVSRTRVKAELACAFGAPVIEQYSSTETGVIACEPLPPLSGKPGSVGRPVVNEVSIMDGEIVVRGPTVFDGYLDDDEANRAAFVGGWYRTGDLGRLDEEGFLTITGRVKELINRGGKKISPREVENVLAAHAAVKELKVFAIPHSSLGQEVAAAAVLREGASASEAELKAFASSQLADSKIPRRIFFRSSLPLGPTKKLDLQALVRECTALLEAERRGRADAGSALLAAEGFIRDLWSASLGTATGLDDNFFLLGGDSLKAVEILLAIEQRFGLELPAEVMYGQGGTVRGLAALVEGTAVSQPRIRPRPRASLSAADLLTLATFAALLPVAWAVPRRAWPTLCAGLAKVHSTFTGPPAPGLAQALNRLKADMTPADLRRRFLSGVYEDILTTLREHAPLRDRAPVRLLGAEHIESARARGRGAVLWVCPTGMGGLLVKRALHEAGVPLVSLRSAIHPYSSTAFGMKWLNRVRTSAEDRYLKASVTLHEKEQGRVAALQALRGHLAANALVSIPSTGAEGSTLELPLLGGTLSLSLGAPILATLCNAPLLPVFSADDGRGGYDVVVAPPIQAGLGRRVGDTARELTRGYADMLEAHLQRHPAHWRGWFMRHTWRCAEPRTADEGPVPPVASGTW
jgi:acyl-CoA synthetase (AMP-forming)/AMP-acid ligase II/acyl carrier protein/lauroyl/myristoyl acyltransferase